MEGLHLDQWGCSINRKSVDCVRVVKCVNSRFDARPAIVESWCLGGIGIDRGEEEGGRGLQPNPNSKGSSVDNMPPAIGELTLDRQRVWNVDRLPGRLEGERPRQPAR